MRRRFDKSCVVHEPYDTATRQIAQQMTDLGATSLHVRRGDYVTNPNASQTFCTCTMDYYRDAMERIPGNDPVYVFSDDLAWAKQTFAEGETVSFSRFRRDAIGTGRSLADDSRPQSHYRQFHLQLVGSMACRFERGAHDRPSQLVCRSRNRRSRPDPRRLAASVSDNFSFLPLGKSLVSSLQPGIDRSPSMFEAVVKYLRRKADPIDLLSKLAPPNTQLKTLVHVGAHLAQERTHYEANGYKSILWIEGSAEIHQRLVKILAAASRSLRNITPITDCWRITMTKKSNCGCSATMGCPVRFTRRPKNRSLAGRP